MIWYWSSGGNLLFHFWFQIAKWKLKTKKQVCCLFTPNHFSTGVCSCLGRVPEIKYSLITLLQKINTHRETYHQPSSVKFSLCLVRECYTAAVIMIAYILLLFSALVFRLTAVVLLSFNKNILVFNSPAAVVASQWEKKASFQSLNLIRGRCDWYQDSKCQIL